MVPADPTPPAPVRRALPLLAWGVALGLCGVVFAWYLQPGFLHTLADRLWSCF